MYATRGAKVDEGSWVGVWPHHSHRPSDKAYVTTVLLDITILLRGTAFSVQSISTNAAARENTELACLPPFIVFLRAAAVGQIISAYRHTTARRSIRLISFPMSFIDYRFDMGRSKYPLLFFRKLSTGMLCE